MPITKELNEQQRKFAQRFVVHGNATKAAEEAGYKHPNVISVRLVSHPKIAAEVERLRGKVEKVRDKSTIADAEEIQTFLTSIVRGKVMDYELSLSGDVEEKPPALGERRKAAMDLARLHGLVVTKNEHTGKDGGPLDVRAYQEMSAAELEAKADELMRLRRGK